MYSWAWEEIKIIRSRRKVGWFRALFVYIGQTRSRRRLRKAVDDSSRRISQMSPEERKKLRERALELINRGRNP
jgi:hypothetical protein